MILFRYEKKIAQRYKLSPSLHKVVWKDSDHFVKTLNLGWLNHYPKENLMLPRPPFPQTVNGEGDRGLPLYCWPWGKPRVDPTSSQQQPWVCLGIRSLLNQLCFQTVEGTRAVGKLPSNLPTTPAWAGEEVWVFKNLTGWFKFGRPVFHFSLHWAY